MSDFHLTADLPADPEKRLQVRADAIKLALEHAVSDPSIRLKMILGEAYARYREMTAWLAVEIEKEAEPVRKLARSQTATLRTAPPEMVQAAILNDAMTLFRGDDDCLTIEATPLPAIRGGG